MRICLPVVYDRAAKRSFICVAALLYTLQSQVAVLASDIVKPANLPQLLDVNDIGGFHSPRSLADIDVQTPYLPVPKSLALYTLFPAG